VPLHIYCPLGNLRLGEDRKKTLPPLRGGKHTERKLSGRQKFAGEIPSRRGGREIVAIVTVIELGFIGIIIITTTFITIITTPSRCNILG
jgi:hypothetical protein